MRILAVDDNPLVLDMLTSLFKQTEFPDISVASSSAETLALLGKKDSRFDCLILDIEMPRMNGIELCSEIRKIEGYQETPIIMLTTRNDAESIEASFAAGANDYIFKRFNVKEFTNRVRVAARLQTEKNNCLTIDLSKLDGTPANAMPEFDFERSLMISGASGMVLPFSLGNYLTQMPQEELDKCGLFAVQMDAAQEILDEHGRLAYLTALEKVATAIVDFFHPNRILVSYIGSGVFMCAARNMQPHAVSDLDARVRRVISPELSNIALPREGLASITVGQPISPYIAPLRRVKRSFKRALDRLEAQHASKGEGSRPDHGFLSQATDRGRVFSV